MIKKILKKIFQWICKHTNDFSCCFLWNSACSQIIRLHFFCGAIWLYVSRDKERIYGFCRYKVDPKDIEVGDILAFYLTPETCATHRVVEKNEEIGSFVTKGDLNATKDVAPVYYNNVIGRTEGKVPLVGYIQIFLMSVMGKIIAFSLIIFDIVIYILIIRDTNKEKQNKKEQENEQKESE